MRWSALATSPSAVLVLLLVGVAPELLLVL
jgi:hypothetical protein